jgi:hypothetical protein
MMQFELDHLFACTAVGAPEADKLIQFGLREGPPNRHPGQGTANRRFGFANAMIELVWVSDPREAQSQSTRRTLLWERWSGRKEAACPFGICLRPVDFQGTGLPFPGWEYRPAYLPDPLFMLVGEAGIEEPMWVYLSFQKRVQHLQRFAEHPAGMREISGLTLTTRVPLSSSVSEKIVKSGILTTRSGATPLLEIEFDAQQQRKRVDFRPQLPLVFQL